MIPLKWYILAAAIGGSLGGIVGTWLAWSGLV